MIGSGEKKLKCSSNVGENVGPEFFDFSEILNFE